MKNMDIYSKVRVKLNIWGIQILKERYDEMCEKNPKMREFLGDYRLPEVDKEGYTDFTLGSLMNIFGPHIETETKLPFDRVILIAEEELKDENTPRR